VVAVKKLMGRGKQSDREFRAEIETVGKVHHPHLVQLLGYCRTKEGKLLVYEYFENGSLNRYMRRGKEMHLDWDTRLKIALGAAEGLAYLHNCEPRIIHRDVKASNILLDKNYDAKVSDFGLARLIDPAKTHVTTFIAGTKAYIAPEYQKSLRLTIKCDVYSYGVVLLELLTGKDPSMGRNFDLITWVKRRMSSCYEFFDVRMLESGHDKDAMTKVLDLALQCTKTSPSQRPSMDEVVVLLKSLRRSQESDEDTYAPPTTTESDVEKNVNEPRDVILTESDTGSVTSEATDDDVFPSKGLDIAFERPYFPRVVSTPVLSDVAKQTENTRAVVSIGDVCVESRMLGLESQSSDVSSALSDEKLSQDSSTSSLPNNNQFVRCESFS
jgi:serine/threonine protein kinase